MLKKKKMRGIDWKKGSAEAVGFAVCLPFLLIFSIAILSTIQTSIVKQTTQYVTYSAARAASLSASFDIAKQRADTVLSVYLYGDKTENYEIKPSITVGGIQELNGDGSKINNDVVEYVVIDPESGREYQYKPNMNTKMRWRNNDILVLTVRIKMNSICPFVNSIKVNSAQQMAAIEGGIEYK